MAGATDPDSELALDRLDADELREGLRTQWMGRRLFHCDTVGSTNDVAWKLAEAGFPHGTVVFAEQQEHGRGSRGRVWHSQTGSSLLFSVVLRMDLPPDRIAGLTATTAVGVVQAIREVTDIDALILWPNDIVVADRRKIGGILAESRSPSPAGPTYVVGTGINIHQGADELPDEIRGRASSLYMLSGEHYPRLPLARRILERMEDELQRLHAGDTATLDRELRRYTYLLGRRVELDVDGAPVRGVVVEISLCGRLVLRLDDDRLETVSPEHVRGKRILDEDDA